MAKTKLCKSCNAEISSKAKTCPKCGVKYGIPGIVKFLILIVVIIVLICACVSSCSKGVSDAIDETIEETKNEYKDINGKTSFKANESFENQHIKLTMTESDTDFKKYSSYFKPKDGFKVIMVKFEAENVGSKDETITIFDFKCYADDVAMEEYLYASDDYQSLNATLSEGKKSFGYGFYEVPKDASKIVVEYDASWIVSGDKIEFVVK